MATLTDPDSFTIGIEVSLFPTTDPPTLRLNTAGNLGAGDNATLQMIYSWGKDEYLRNETIRFYQFFLDLTTPESGTWLDNWEPHDDATRKRIAKAGWKERTKAGAVKREYCGIISTPPTGVKATEQPYYEHAPGVPVNFARLGAVQEPVQIYGDATHGNFDRRNSDIIVRCREQGKTTPQGSVFANYSITRLSTECYRVGIETEIDAKIIAEDIEIDANGDGIADVAPYSGMVLQRHAVAQTITMAGGTYSFQWTLNCNGGTISQAHTYLAWLARKNADIDAGSGTLNGKTAPMGTRFIGDALFTNQLAASEGLALTNFSASNINDVTFVDNTGQLRGFSYTGALLGLIPEAGRSDPSAILLIYPTATYGLPGCVLVKDASGNDMIAEVNGDATKTFSFDWTANGDLDVTAVLIGRTVKICRATTTIVRSTTNQVSLAGAEDPNYLNP